MYNNSSLISPLPKITVQHRVEKVNTKITQMIKKLGKRREMQILEERSQGFWMEDQVKLTLDRIKMRAHRMKTMPIILNAIQKPSKSAGRKHKTYDKNINTRKPQQNKYILPELKQMVQSRQYESDKLIIEKRRKILHLLILGLNRRNLGRLYEAMDIILLASFYFEKDDEERVLKSICLSLISKLHKEIKNQNSSMRKKSKLTKKRKSLTVLNYISRENFLENFMIKLRKTKLMGEFSFAESNRHNSNIRRINGKCDVVIPKPDEIFDPELGVSNYDYIAVTVDDYTNSFPYEYPKSLSEKIDPTEYKQMICKLNGLLFPESKCYSFSSIIKLFYLPFMLIFVLMLCFSILRTFIVNQIGRITLIIATLLAVFVLGIKISVEESGYTNYIEIKDKMKAYLHSWELKYEQMHIKFRMGENVDAIFIAFPSEFPDSSLASSKLTQIQEVDQNNTEVLTNVKGKKQLASMKGIRRTGSRFDENGNLMRKKTLSKYTNSDHRSNRKLSDVSGLNDLTELADHIRKIQSESDDENIMIMAEPVQKQPGSDVKTIPLSQSLASNGEQTLKIKTSLEKKQQSKYIAYKKNGSKVEQLGNNQKMLDRKPTLKKIPSNMQKNQSEGSCKAKQGNKKVSHIHIKIEDSVTLVKKSSNREETSVSKLVTPQSNGEEK